ncbi:FUSC family protein [Winogradskyella maritima]|uniref:Aromatic acid exporter family protein n=1 Tax=Winogradskyella maritima TaxID=1517766 RepID=A0ABV8AFU1_9FLAO|nr:FUSC family protein [Winogradskyella maritima]
MTIPFNFSKVEIKDALRLALQSAVSAALTFVILKYFNLPEVFVAVLSAVLVVEPSIGNTFIAAKGRVLATIVGSAIGFILLVVIPWGFGTALSLAIAMFVLNGISSFKPTWRYGVVAAVAIALGSTNDAWDTSLDRIIAIGIGVAVGILVSFVVWPEKSETRTKRHIKNALRALYKRFEFAIDNTRSEENEGSAHASKFHESLSKAKQSVGSITFNDPKGFRNQINQIEKLYNSTLIINRVALNTKADVTDGDSGIEKNTEDLKLCALDLIKDLIDNECASEEKLEEFKEQISKVKDNFKNSEDNRDLNLLRHAFVFGVLEIQDSLIGLNESFSD